MCRLTFFYITDAKVFPCPSKEVRANQQKALQGLIQGKENIPLTALGFAASKAVCGSGPKWPITHIYESLITTLLYWPLICILVACLMWRLWFSTSSSHSVPQDCHWSHVCCLQHQSCKFVDTAAQILRNSKKQQKNASGASGRLHGQYLFISIRLKLFWYKSIFTVYADAKWSDP